MEKIDFGQKNVTELNKIRETAELKKNLAQELKKPENGSFLKKLKRLGGALALAGITTLSPNSAIAPETTEEYRIAKSGMDLEKESYQNLELFKRVDKALEETGGIKISPQLETVYKVMPEITKILAMGKVANGEIPYFSKPEVILGQEFIYQHPKEAGEYMDKIRKTMKATVMVFKGASLIGSGTIVDTGDGAAIITNEHVAKYDKGDFSFITAGGENFKARRVFADQDRDLAILESNENLTTALKEKKINALKLASKEIQEKLDFGDKLAAIGHPRGFPFEVATSECVNIEKTLHHEPTLQLIRRAYSDYIFSFPDPRFAKLQTYDNKIVNMPVEAKKGNILGGMSGGPVISLDKKGEPEIVGITTINAYNPESQNELIGGAISAEDIRKHLEEYSVYKKTPESKLTY